LLTCGDTLPDAEANAVCVSVTTKRQYSDPTVVLSVGDHPFIKHESVINYADARILDLQRVQAALDAHTRTFTCMSHKPCSEDLLARVQGGLLKSPYPTKSIKAFFRSALGVRG
jgi:hypothetical protein